MHQGNIDDYEIHHYGVKGMKWGIRRYQNYGKGDGQYGKGKFLGSAKKTVNYLKKQPKKMYDSKARELKFINDSLFSPEISKMSVKEKEQFRNRIRNEKQLKKLSRNLIIGPKRSFDLRNQYLDRANLSDNELNEIVMDNTLLKNIRKEALVDVEAQAKNMQNVIDVTKDIARAITI